MFSALFELLTGNFLFFALHFDSRSVFPKPLSAKEERECFERMAQGDKAAKDLISIGTIGLIKAVSTFDHKKGCRFATYGSRCVENEILMHFRSQKKSANDIHFDEPVDSDKDGNQLCLIDIIADGEDVADKIELSIRSEQLYRYIESSLDERERQIVTLRYGLFGQPQLPQREVAKRLGISRSYVSRIEKKALKLLKDRFDKQ